MNRMMLPNLRLAQTLGPLANDMEELMNRVWSGGERSAQDYSPHLDIAETEDRFEVCVDLPGVKLEDVRVELEEDHLTISGRRESVKRDDGKNYHRIERAYGEFGRTVLLPKVVDPEAIEATYEDGVLRVTLPKSVKERSRRIEIKAGQRRQGEVLESQKTPAGASLESRKKNGKANA